MANDPLPPGAASWRAGDGHESGDAWLKRPGRWAVWLPRAWILLAAGFVALSAADLVQTALAAQATGPPLVGLAVVVTLTAGFTVPLAVLAWQSTSRPYPGIDTLHALTESLDKAERKTVNRALRRGHAIAPAHRAYAVATTAANRRALIFGGLVPALQWGQVTIAADREFGSGFFWTMAVGAAVLSVLISGFVAFQLRCERSVHASEQ